MKVVYTQDAVRDLDDILSYLAERHPAVVDAVAERIREAVAQIAMWPESKPRIDQRTDVRVAFLGKYPYRIFYRATHDRITVLHIHHAARRRWRPAD